MKRVSDAWKLRVRSKKYRGGVLVLFPHAGDPLFLLSDARSQKK
jgi:hypothetical protein